MKILSENPTKNQGMNFICWTCRDTGKVGIIFRKVCPKCFGDPTKEIPPRPKMCKHEKRT